MRSRASRASRACVASALATSPPSSRAPIVFPIGAREEGGEVAKADATQALDALEALERMHVLRADAVHQDFVQLAHFAPTGHRQGQYVPERKAQIIDQHLTARIG